MAMVNELIGNFGALLMFISLMLGCGGEPFGQVTGTVTLDAEPLSNATVTFQRADGVSAIGMTNERGEYELQSKDAKKGVVVGTYKVVIETYRIESQPGKNPIELDERIPVRYNRDSELSREVKKGPQTFYFALPSK